MRLKRGRRIDGFSVVVSYYPRALRLANADANANRRITLLSTFRSPRRPGAEGTFNTDLSGTTGIPAIQTHMSPTTTPTTPSPSPSPPTHPHPTHPHPHSHAHPHAHPRSDPRGSPCLHREQHPAHPTSPPTSHAELRAARGASSNDFHSAGARARVDSARVVRACAAERVGCVSMALALGERRTG